MSPSERVFMHRRLAGCEHIRTEVQSIQSNGLVSGRVVTSTEPGTQFPSCLFPSYPLVLRCLVGQHDHAVSAFDETCRNGNPLRNSGANRNLLILQRVLCSALLHILHCPF